MVRAPADKNSIFYTEHELLSGCQQLMDSGEMTAEQMAESFEKLIHAYARLLRQTRKITRVGDSIQRKLVKAREEISIKNKHLIEAQNQLVLKEKMLALNTLTNGIAHEISNPLNFINNFANLHMGLVADIKERLESVSDNLDADVWSELSQDLEDLSEGAGIIQEQGVRTSKIVESMAQLTSLSNENVGGNQPIDLMSLVNNCASAAFNLHGGRSGLEGMLREPVRSTERVIIQGVPEELSLVMTQLFQNAFEALVLRVEVRPEPLPLLRYSVTVEDEFVFVRIADNGIGIKGEHMDKIFTPFFTTKEAAANIGLGLPISYDIIVNGYNGELLVETCHEGLTNFIAKLPLGKEISEGDDQ